MENKTKKEERIMMALASVAVLAIVAIIGFFSFSEKTKAHSTSLEAGEVVVKTIVVDDIWYSSVGKLGHSAYLTVETRDREKFDIVWDTQTYEFFNGKDDLSSPIYTVRDRLHMVRWSIHETPAEISVAVVPWEQSDTYVFLKVLQ